MFCPECSRPNAADAEKCAFCDHPTDYYHRHIFIGNQFVFVRADEKHPIALGIDGAVQTFHAPAILSRHYHSLTFGDEMSAAKPTPKATLLRRAASQIGPMPDQPQLPAPTLALLTVVTDRKIYKPNTPAAIFAIAPHAANTTAQIEVQLAGQKVYEADLELNADGMALHHFEDTREGEYTVILTLPGHQRADCTFSVAEFTLSPLVATLKTHAFEGKILSFSLNLLRLSAPYNGPVQLGLQCGVCGEQVVATLQVTVENGQAKGEFDISGHGGPFHVQIVSPDGLTAVIAFPGTGAVERRRIPINRLGSTAEMGLLPWEKAQAVRGFYIGAGEMNMTPLLLESAHTCTARLQAAAHIEQVKICLFNPYTGARRIIEQTDLKRGDTLEFAVDGPYTLFTAGIMQKKEPFEGWGVVIKPVAFEAELSAPATALPGAEIALEIHATTPSADPAPAYCWLLVYDARLEHESPTPKLAKCLYESIRDATGNLVAGRVPDSENRFYKPTDDFVRANAAMGTGVVLRSMAPPPMPFAVPATLGGMPEPAMKTMAAEVEAMPMPAVEVAPIRMEFPELAYLELFYFEGLASRTVKLGEQIGTWRVRAYVIKGADYRELTADIQADKPLYAELDLPAIAATGDAITAAVTYHTNQPAQLTISTAAGQTQAEVNGHGVTHFAVTGPGKVEVRLENASGTDWAMGEILPPGVQKMITSRLLLLDAGQTAQAEKVMVYTGPGQALKDTITALIHYPFGCAEQTSSALYGLAVAYRGITAGVVPGDLPTTQGRILAGLQRLSTFQYTDGLFSLWCHGQPDKTLTARVAHRLLGLRGLPFAMADELLKKAEKALLENHYRDNALLALNPAFKGNLLNPEDATAHYFGGNDKDRQEALALLRQTVKRDGDKAYWEAELAWGGNLEVTADAARVLAHAGDALFRPAFTYVTGKLVNGMLYSTADTRALVELLASLKYDPATQAVIDGQTVSLAEVSAGKSVTALSNNLLVRLDEVTEINYLEPRADFQFAVKPEKTRLMPGERIKIVITPQEKTLCPLARVFLPGNLAMLKGGANAQTAYLPIEREALTVEVVAVRPGRGKLYVSVLDMYDAEKVGVIPGLEMEVVDPRY